ncbi:MAG: alpha-mannosidase [Opitutaceae bacterium]|jgi:alpha-mannosidase
MLKHFEVTKSRFGRFVGELKALLYPQSCPLKNLTVYSAPDRIGYENALKGEYRPAAEGEFFGPGWSTHWFRIEYEVPAEWRAEEVLIHFNSSSEGCVWRDGVPLQGLTSYNAGPEDIRSYFTLLPKAKGGEHGVIHVEAAINGMSGLCDGWGRLQKHELGHLRHARLVTRDRKVWDLLWDFVIIKEIAERLPQEGPHQPHALSVANQIINAVIIGDSSTYEAGRKIARRFFSVGNGSRNHHVSAIGHAHIDTAWLWPLAETKRKCYRSFSTAVRMMETYPDYKFACSQAQQLLWIKEGQPALWKKLKAMEQRGQFIPVGGTWIEPDCNIPNGESLVRQFLLGQQFFRSEFGKICREFWNPDVFGYSGALPQIMNGSGIRYFLTQKLSWNQFNRPTSSTFLWEGIDGSRVLTHFPPSDTYNGFVSVEEVQRHYTNFKDKERSNESYLLFGYGDGGGGPTEEMMERVHRLRDVPGLPDVHIRTPGEFFARCENDIKDPIVWSGELYFEKHRGTYTTQAANKRDNRRSEEALHDAEFLCVLAFLSDCSPYPQKTLNDLWRTVLLNQFHDIIPGSSITEVYQDSANDYARVLGTLETLRNKTLASVFGKTSDKQNRFAALNTTGWPRREVVRLSDGRLVLADAPAYGYAVIEDKSIAASASLKSKPVSLHDSPSAPPLSTVHARITKAGFVIENALVCARFDRDGHLRSFFDKRHAREIIATGTKGNQFVLYEDKPSEYDAWDVEIFHLEKRKNVGMGATISIVENDPLRAMVRLVAKLGDHASLVQHVSLSADSPRLDFDNEVEWRESNQFLKVEFPLSIRSDHATYEIQFGHVRRPTHFNTTWDFARFEVSAHRWADLSEPGFGVALLNDCKYGYACHGNVLRLSLLRAPKVPDPVADMGRHRFRYALFPHANGAQLGGVIPESAAFNQPLRIVATSLPLSMRAFFTVDNAAVVLDTIKKAEDDDAVIIRLYESHGAPQATVLTVPSTVKSAARVNLLETEESPVATDDKTINIVLKPFEIVTLKLVLHRPDR